MRSACYRTVWALGLLLVLGTLLVTPTLAAPVATPAAATSGVMLDTPVPEPPFPWLDGPYPYPPFPW